MKIFSFMSLQFGDACYINVFGKSKVENLSDVELSFNAITAE